MLLLHKTNINTLTKPHELKFRVYFILQHDKKNDFKKKHLININVSFAKRCIFTWFDKNPVEKCCFSFLDYRSWTDRLDKFCTQRILIHWRGDIFCVIAITMETIFDNGTLLNVSAVEDQSSEPITPLLISFMIVGFLSLTLNGGVFILVIKAGEIRSNPYHFLVMMLSVSDFFMGLATFSTGPRVIIPSLHRSRILAVVQICLMSNGLYLSLVQIFLISLQRFAIICTEKLNTYIFCENRKYFTCFGSWMVVIVGNLSFVSPPPREYNFVVDSFLTFVYNGRYLGYLFFNRLLTISLLSATIILYLITLRYVSKHLGKLSNEKSKNVKVKPYQVFSVSGTETETRLTSLPSHRPNSPSPHQANKKIVRTAIRSKLGDARHKKVKGTLTLVGILITVLIVLTGPLMVFFWGIGSTILLRLSFCICSINSLVNPFIYMWKLPSVRKYIESKFICRRTA